MTVVGEATVIVRADAKGFDSSLKKQLTGTGTAAASADKELRNFSSSASGASRFSRALNTQAGLLGATLGAAGLGGAAAIAAGAIGQKLVSGMSSAVKAASDLTEQQNKVRVVFGDSARDVLDFGEDASTAIGQSNRAALEGAGTFGNLFRAIGLTEDKSAEMSTSLVKLASDLASFNNADPSEVLDALRSGLVGEVEPLRKFGVQLSEERLKQEALNQGLKAGKGPLDAATKSQAAYGLILKDTALAQGDYAATSDSLANSTRTLGAQIEDLQAEFGEVFAPSVASATNFLSDFIAEAEKGKEVTGGLGQELKTALAGAVFGPIGGIKAFFDQVRGGKDAAEATEELAAADADLRLISQEVTGQLQEQTQATEEQTKALDEATRSQLERIKAQVSARNAEEDYRVAIEDVSRVQRDNRENTEDAARSIRDAQRAVTDSKRAYEDAQRSVEDMTRALADQREENQRLKDSVPRAEFDLTRSREGQTRAAEELAQAEEDLRNIRRFVETTPREIQDAERRVKDARLGVTEAAFATKDSEQQLKDLREEIADGPRRMADAERDLADARQAVLDKRDAIIEAERGVSEARREAADVAREGQERLHDAQQKVETSALAVADASVKLAQEQAEANGQTFTAADANEAYRVKLNQVSATLDPKSPLRSRLRAYADEIKGVEGLKKTVLQLDSKQAMDDLTAFEQSLKRVFGDNLATGTASASDGDAVSGGIPGSITVDVNFKSDIDGTATAVSKKQGAVQR